MPLRDGWIARDAATGRFREVQISGGDKTRVTETSTAAVEQVSARRSAALRRLADR